MSITFADSSYSYTGDVTPPSPGFSQLNETGKYKLLQGRIELLDDYLLRMVMSGPSLYLGGTFQYDLLQNNLTIRQSLSSMSTVITLQRQQ
jgi:hypothetical protein